MKMNKNCWLKTYKLSNQTNTHQNLKTKKTKPIRVRKTIPVGQKRDGAITNDPIKSYVLRFEILSSVARLGDFESSWQQICLQNSPKTLGTFLGYFEKHHSM